MKRPGAHTPRAQAAPRLRQDPQSAHTQYWGGSRTQDQAKIPRAHSTNKREDPGLERATSGKEIKLYLVVPVPLAAPVVPAVPLAPPAPDPSPGPPPPPPSHPSPGTPSSSSPEGSVGGGASGPLVAPGPRYGSGVGTRSSQQRDGQIEFVSGGARCERDRWR